MIIVVQYLFSIIIFIMIASQEKNMTSIYIIDLVDIQYWPGQYNNNVVNIYLGQYWILTWSLYANVTFRVSLVIKLHKLKSKVFS